MQVDGNPPWAQLLRRGGHLCWWVSAKGTLGPPRAACISRPCALTEALGNRMPCSCCATWNAISQTGCTFLLGYLTHVLEAFFKHLASK